MREKTGSERGCGKSSREREEACGRGPRIGPLKGRGDMGDLGLDAGRDSSMLAAKGDRIDSTSSASGLPVTCPHPSLSPRGEHGGQHCRPLGDRGDG
jgi:hypothetical protein